MAISDGLESRISGISEQSHFQALDPALFKSWNIQSKEASTLRVLHTLLRWQGVM